MFLLDFDDLFGPLLEESIGLGIAAVGGLLQDAVQFVLESLPCYRVIALG